MKALAFVERSLLEQAMRGRKVLEAGALRLCIASGASEPPLHVAVAAGDDPGPGPDAWRPPIATLLAAGRSVGGVPRVEIMRELHPGLPAALEEAGFRLSSADPVMVAPCPVVVPTIRPPATRCLDLQEATAHQLLAFADAQSRAFGMAEATGRAFLGRLREGLESGEDLGGALLEGGTLVAGATLLRGGPAAELAGVWTASERRRRGLASYVCQRVSGQSAEAGIDTAWLSAARGAEGLYHGLSFRRVGTQLDYVFGEPRDGAGVARHGSSG